jgi:hypothetical protein
VPRVLSPTFINQLASKGSCSPILFAVLAFANETLYLFGGVGSMTPAGPPYSATSVFPYGETFLGMGWLARVSGIPQTTKVQAQSVTLSLSGIPSDLVAEAIGQVRVSGTAQIFLGFMNSSGALIADPVQLFAGALDVPTINDSGETSTISITAENPLLLLNEAPSRTFDDADQQIYVPGDLGMSFVEALPNLPLYWPAPTGWTGAYPVDFVMTPTGADIAVGGTVTIYTTINYSDGSYYTLPGGTGSGSPWLGGIVSSNPKVATVNGSGVVTGISPGVCEIIATSVYPAGASSPSGSRRTSTSVIVHS